MGLCGSDQDGSMIEPDGNGISLCYRSLLFLAIPTALGVLGFSFACMQELKLRRMKTLFTWCLVVRFVQAIDWVRFAFFLVTGFAPGLFFWYENGKWEVEGTSASGNMAPYVAIDIFIYGGLLWTVLGCGWLMHEIRRGSEEWLWLRFFTFTSVIGEGLVLWSTVQNLDEDYGEESSAQKDFAVARGATLVGLKFMCFFVMVCFNRDWRRLRKSLRSYQSPATNQGSLLGEHLISMQNESFIEASDMRAVGASDALTRDQGESDSMLGPFVGDGVVSHGESTSELERTPEQYAGLLSRLLFFWLEPIMRKGSLTEFKSEDFYRLLRSDEPQTISSRFGSTFKVTLAEDVAKEQATAARKARVTAEGAQEDAPYVRLEGNGEAQGDEAAQDEKSKAKDAGSAPEGRLWTTVKAMHRAGVLGEFYKAAFFKWMYDTLQFVGPQLLKHLINFLNSSHKDGDKSEGYFYVALMFGSSVVQTFVLHIYFHKAFRTGMRVRSSFLTAIYQKSLRLTPSARQQRTTGEVVNLMSADCERLNGLFPYLHVTWSSPYQVALAIYFLWAELHYSVIVSVVFMFFVMTPMTVLVGKRIQAIQKQLMKVKDTRIRAAGEAVASIKVIKLYGWERNFRERVQGLREDELKLLRTYVIWRAAARTLWGAGPVLVTLATFASFVLLGGTLDAATAFTSASLLNILRFPLAMLPTILNSAIEASVSIRRIASFLEAEELDLKALEQVRRETERPKGSAVFVKNGNFYWDDKYKAQALKDVNLDIKEGTFTVITGEVGSGKSALLSMLSGELQPGKALSNRGEDSRPKLSVGGSVALAAQVPWIQNATLRDNILFGQPYEREWYNHVIASCSLSADLDQLAEGDETEIGERGINLSGGQKARISLARAVYSRADILLLETCFEAVDEHVSAFLSRHCFQGILREPNPITGRRRTVLLVTHALKYVTSADKVVVMKHGAVVEQGNFADFMADRSSELSRLAAQSGDSVSNNDEKPRAKEGAESDEQAQDKIALKRKESSFRAPKPLEKGKGQLTGKEGMAVGNVSTAVYKAYMDATGGPWTLFTVILGLAIRTGFDTGTSTWLAYWSSSSKPKDDPAATAAAVSAAATDPAVNFYNLSAAAFENVSTVVDFAVSRRALLDHSALGLERSGLDQSFASPLDPVSFLSVAQEEPLGGAASEHGTGFYLGIYALLSFSGLIFLGCLTAYIALVALQASRSMHNKMLIAVMRAPMSFFDTTPIGRLLNRMSKDVYTIDETLPDSMFSFLSTIFSVLGTIVTISAVTPPFLLLLPLMFFVYLRIQRYYIATSRQVKRWDSVLRSPIFSNFSESLDGVGTIRAYGATPRFIRHNLSLLESQLGPYYISISANRWLAIRLETIGSFLVLFTSLFVLLTLGDTPAAFGALAISYALSVTQTLNWTVRMSSEIETNIVSVERVNEYMELAPEAPESDPDLTRVPPALAENPWPSKGAITFENVSARYRPELDLVLKDLSFTVQAGEKIGVVGRTGCGKSSTLLVLLRIIECAGGRVLIDGYDTHDFGLERLRTAISIIPQDPTIFSTSIRENMDPMSQFSDQAIWKALELAHLKEYVQSLAGDEHASEEFPTAALDFVISESGGNMSFGQRQLLCIARAILRRCKIVLLDEPTSALDMRSDELIQTTIQTEFHDSTMLTIAHRLQTLATSDKILVMDAGRAVEFAPPDELLAKKGIYYSLVNQMNESKNKI